MHIKKKINNSDYLECAKIHKEEIPNGFLSKLGNDFLKRLYKSVNQSNYSFLIIVSKRKKIIGFAACSTNIKKFYFFFIYKNLVFLTIFFLIRIYRLNFFLKIYETLVYPFLKKSKNKETKIDTDAQLLNICVSTKYQRQGVGTLLFNQIEKKFRELKTDKFRIVTGYNQISASRFYKKLNVINLKDVNIHSNQKSHLFIYKL